MMRNCEAVTIFDIYNMEHIDGTNRRVCPKRLEEQTNLLLIVIEGNGKLQSSSSSHWIGEGDIFALRPGSEIQSLSAISLPLSIYYIEFSIAKIHKKEGNWFVENEPIQVQGKTNVGQLSILYHHLKELYDDWHSETGKSADIQYGFWKVWEIVTSRLSEQEQKLDSKQAVARITEYIDKHYEKDFQIEQMAQFSGLNSASFYQEFKGYTSLPPLQYITKTRVRQAQQLLSTEKIKIDEVAKTIGYSDVYYFSRVFKKNIGISPLKFQNLSQRKFAVLSPIFMWDLVALGIPKQRITVFLNQERQQKYELEMYGKAFHLELLRKERPDFIIGTDKDVSNYEELAEIAPTWIIPYKKNSWRERFIQLATIVDAREVALNWLRFYDLKAEIASEKIRKELADETILAARVSKTGVRVFGEDRAKVGDLLYRDLKVKAPHSANGFRFKDIGHLEDLDLFHADHILLFDDLQEHAVRSGSLQGKIHRARVNPWLHYSALGHVQALDEAVKVFAKKSTL